MRITIVGHGYVGLVTASVFADFGNEVTVIGRTPEKIRRLNAGDPLIYEPGLEELLQRNLEAKRIHFTLKYDPAIKNSEVIFVAVGTPTSADGAADLSQVRTVVREVATHLKHGYSIVAIKSTVPVGTNAEMKQLIAKTISSKNQKFDIVSCPEFLREGTAINDTKHPDRVVLGSNSKSAIEKMLELHQPIGGERVITDLPSAELIKYASNSLLATKISFANLIAFYCEATGANAPQVLKAVGLDKRIGNSFLQVGIGYGGACFPKDVKALIHSGKLLGLDNQLLQEVEHINQVAKERFSRSILEKIGSKVKKKIAVWGISFKPNTDDTREAPAFAVIEKLVTAGHAVTAYDPAAMEHAKTKFGNKIALVSDPYAAVAKADVLVINTEWNEFRQIDLERVKQLLKTPLIFDGRNVYSPEKMKRLGFEYHSIGRKTVQ